jgi:signal transduction histidine kinase
MLGSRIATDAVKAGRRPRLRLPYGGPLRAVLGIGTLLILLIVAGAVLIGIELRGREVRSAERELTTLDTVLAEETSRAFQSVDLVLLSLLEELRAEGIDTADDYRRLKAGPETYELLHSRIAGLPQLDAVTLIATDGQLINFSRFFPIPPVNVSDRDYYKALSQAGSGPEPFVSEPVENRGTGTRTVYLARRVLSRGGTLIGFVLAAIDLNYFNGFYASLNLDRGDSISLWRQDGTFLVRYPVLQDADRLARGRLKGLGASGSTPVTEVARAMDGQSRLMAHRLVPTFPLVVAVSRTMDAVLADWRNQVLLTGIMSTLAVLAVLTVMAALARQFDVYESLARAVREREEAVAAREQAEAQLRQAQKLEAIGQLTSGVAHDFNNYLTVVIGNLEMVERRLPEAEPLLRRYVESALAGAARAATLTKRLLAFSRREELAPQQVDVNGLVMGMADILRQTLGGIALQLDLAPEPWPVFADPSQLESALLNLVVNARDAMPDGGRVEVATRNIAAEYESAACVEIVVADTGTGMPAEIVRRAMEPFFTTKEAGRGTGLGLAQVHSFANEARGEVLIESELGAGTRVRLRLPRCAGERTGPEAQARFAASGAE